MNYLLKNRIDEVEEMKKAIVEATELENQILAQGKNIDDNNSLSRAFQDKLSEIRFAQANVIQGIKHIKVENKEELLVLLNLVNYVKNAKFGNFDNHLCDNLIDNYYELSVDSEFGDIFRKQVYKLLENNEGYLDRQEGKKTLNIVAQALRDATSDNSSNTVVDKYFNDFYSTRKLIELADKQDWSYGKSFVVYLAQDYSIDRKYIKAIKNAYQDYAVEEKYQNMNFKSRVAIGTGKAIAIPLKVAKVGIRLGLLSLELAGMTLKFVGNALAYPFEKASKKLLKKDGKNIDELQAILLGVTNPKYKRMLTLAKVVNFPAKVFKGAGKIISTTCNVTSALINVGTDLAMVPFDMLVKSILKVGDVHIADKIDPVENKIKSNLLKVLKDKDKRLTNDDINIFTFEVKDNVLTILGNTAKNNSTFIIDYQIDDSASEKLKIIKENQKRIMENLNYIKIFKEVEKILSQNGSTITIDDLNNLPINFDEELTEVDKAFGFENIGIVAEMKRALKEYQIENSNKDDEFLLDTLKSLRIDRLLAKDDKFDTEVFKEAKILSNITTQKYLNLEYFENKIKSDSELEQPEELNILF